MPIAKSNGTVAEAPKEARVLTPTQPENPTKTYVNADDAKSQRILRQGVFQAVLQSPGIAGLPFATLDEYLALVNKAAERVIESVQK